MTIPDFSKNEVIQLTLKRTNFRVVLAVACGLFFWQLRVGTYQCIFRSFLLAIYRL